MDSNSERQDELSDVERRLSSWRPETEGLSRDAMLFAAGLAAGRTGHGQRLWPTVCAALAIAAVAVGAWGVNERHECQLLLGRLQDHHEHAPSVSAPSNNALAVSRVTAAAASPNSYFNLRKQLEHDPGEWLASQEPIPLPPLGPGPPEPSILRASQYESLLNQ